MPEIKEGTVTVVIPDTLQLPDNAGQLSKKEKQSLPRARRGIGLVGEHTAIGMKKSEDTAEIEGISADGLAKMCADAESIDTVIADLEVALEQLKQANLLMDADAHTALRKVYAQLSAKAKFDGSVAERFSALFAYFGRK